MESSNEQSCEVSFDVVSLLVDGELIALLKEAAASEVACAAAMGAGEREPT